MKAVRFHQYGPADEIRHVIRLVAEGKLRAIVDSVFPLERAADAHRLLEERRQFGKVILTP